MSQQKTRILIVDDSRLDQKLLGEYLSPHGYALEYAGDGEAALAMLYEEPLRFDVVLLDRSMPRLTGMELLHSIKGHPRLRMLPVILQTASTSRESIVEGFRAGALYYLPKPYDVEILLTVVAAATREFGMYKRLQEALSRGLECLTLIQDATITLQTIDQARSVAMVLANTCPDPAAVVVGLSELLVNAIEHGNLGITYEEKSALTKGGNWHEEVRRRLALAENAGKQVVLRVERGAAELKFTIRDEGRGFSWPSFFDVDPKRAFDNHGRGIAIARSMSFDTVEYRGCGNEVVATVRLPPKNESRPLRVG